MRLPISSVIASLFVALTTPNSPSMAQQGVGGSSIRLTSASESVDYDSSAQSNEQSYDPPPVQPVRQQAMQSGPSLTPPVVHTPAQPPAMSGTKMPAGFYASAEARATLQQLPGPAPVRSAPRPQTTRRGGKPFQGIQSQSTISPYLYMNAAGGSSTAITNYLAFVRPELEKEEANRQQQREIQQLRAQVQKMSTTEGTNMRQSTRQNTAAHYMDTAQFYRGWQR